MRILVISEDDTGRIRALVAAAKEHPVARETLLATIAGTEPPAGDNAQNVLNLQDGYRVVYTEEDQPAGTCAHLSVSVEGVALPHPVAVNLIMEAYGMGSLNKSLHTWIENDRAINVLSLLQKKESNDG